MANSDRKCNLLEPCMTPEAPICPLQETTIKNGIWYADEPVCQSLMFENLPWIKKQKAIAALKLKADDGFFTVKMLNALKTVEQGIKGADPADDNAEANWLKEHYSPRKNTSKKRISQTRREPPANARLF
jgi:hypothetical protein